MEREEKRREEKTAQETKRLLVAMATCAHIQMCVYTNRDKMVDTTTAATSSRRRVQLQRAVGEEYAGHTARNGRCAAVHVAGDE